MHCSADGISKSKSEFGLLSAIATVAGVSFRFWSQAYLPEWVSWSATECGSATAWGSAKHYVSRNGVCFVSRLNLVLEGDMRTWSSAGNIQQDACTPCSCRVRQHM